MQWLLGQPLQACVCQRSSLHAPDMADLSAVDADRLSADWRTAKAHQFEARLKSLELDGNHAAVSLLQQLQDSTVKLHALHEAQKKSGRPWWADSCADDCQADEANEQAVRMYAKKDYTAAFKLWTTAIKLCPRKAVYHCNRAASALKLNQYALAAEDTRHAIERDPCSLKALLRAGHAHMGMQQPGTAANMFKQALQLDCSSAVAKRGLEAAHKAEAEEEKTAAQQQQQMLPEGRAGLPRHALPDQSAVGQSLYDAEAMLKAQPNLEAAKCCCVELRAKQQTAVQPEARMMTWTAVSCQGDSLAEARQALIACRRYGDAETRAAELGAGVDKLYLQAEIAWRRDAVDAALSYLQRACQISAASSKCCELQRWLLGVQARCHSIRLALEDGQAQSCIQECTSMLAEVQPEACSGLYANILHQQAQAQLHGQQYDAALQSLEKAMLWEPYHTECLLLKALVCREAGLYTESFMALQKLSRITPNTPGLYQQLQQAADLCLGDSAKDCTESRENVRRSHSAEAHWLKVLGLTASASAADVRHAYKRLAAQWHPDKWGSSCKQDQDEAHAKFLAIASAYRELCDVGS